MKWFYYYGNELILSIYAVPHNVWVMYLSHLAHMVFS